MKTLNPEKEVTVKLKTHMLVTLWHVLNAAADTHKAFNKSYGSTYKSPTFYEDKSKKAPTDGYNYIQKVFMETFNIGYISDVCYDNSVRFKLNDELEAEVVGDDIKVGCATFPIEKIRELIDKIDESK